MYQGLFNAERILFIVDLLRWRYSSLLCLSSFLSRAEGFPTRCSTLTKNHKRSPKPRKTIREQSRLSQVTPLLLRMATKAETQVPKTALRPMMRANPLRTLHLRTQLKVGTTPKTVTPLQMVTTLRMVAKAKTQTQTQVGAATRGKVEILDLAEARTNPTAKAQTGTRAKTAAKMGTRIRARTNSILTARTRSGTRTTTHLPGWSTGSGPTSCRGRKEASGTGSGTSSTAGTGRSSATAGSQTQSEGSPAGTRTRASAEATSWADCTVDQNLHSKDVLWIVCSH